MRSIRRDKRRIFGRFVKVCGLARTAENRGLAETEGFEPSVGVIPLRRFSKPLVSATHPRLRMCRTRGYRRARGGDQWSIPPPSNSKSTRSLEVFIASTFLKLLTQE